MMTIPWWLFLLAMAGAMWIGMGVMAALSINRGVSFFTPVDGERSHHAHSEGEE